MPASSPRLALQFLVAGGLPAWIQAVCAMGLLGLGILAYNSWREQETAKSRASVAERILLNVYSAVSCLDASIMPILSSVPNNKEIEEFSDNSETAASKCSPHFDKLDVDMQWANNVLGTPSYEAISIFKDFHSMRLLNLWFLRGHLRDRPEKLRDISSRADREKDLRKVMAAVGKPAMHLDQTEPTEQLPLSEIEKIRKEWEEHEDAMTVLQRHKQTIEELLSPHLRFQ